MSDPGKTNGIRWTAKRKAEVVLALLKGGDTTELCRKNGITKSVLYSWRDSFIEAGIKIMNEMATFDSAGVSNKGDE